MKPSKLTIVPKEILFMIFSNLGPLSLSRMCHVRVLSDVARDLLYRQFYGGSHNIAKFLRTILENPELALRVQYVYLEELHTSQGSKLSRECVDIFAAAIEGLPVSQSIKRPWTQRTIEGHKEALAALLLAHVPRVTGLEIWAQDQYAQKEYGVGQFLLQCKPFWMLVMPQLGRGHPQSPFLNKIQTLNLLSLPCSVYDLASVFTLPELRSLHTWDVVETRQQSQLPHWAFSPRSNRISTLELTSASLSIGTLRRMILSCTQLETFTYNCPTPRPDFSSLVDVLSGSYETVKKLTFLDQNAWSGEIVPIRSLASLTSLEHFSGDAAVMIGELDGTTIFDMFPESLCQLHLQDVPTSMIDSLGGASGIIDRITELKAGVLPHLTRVELVRASSSFGNEDFVSEIYLQDGLQLWIKGKLAHDSMAEE